MTAIRCTHVEVYVFRRQGGRARFLVLRRAPGRVLPGAWQPITGRRRAGESAFQAARREVREETGLAPARWWALECPTVYFDAAADAVLALPLFAAEVAPGARVRRSREHDAHAFLPPAAAARRFLWEAQRRGLEAVRREVLRGGALAAALALPTARPARPGARRPA